MMMKATTAAIDAAILVEIRPPDAYNVLTNPTLPTASRNLAVYLVVHLVLDLAVLAVASTWHSPLR